LLANAEVTSTDKSVAVPQRASRQLRLARCHVNP
jgi:hypothetical protein